MQDCYLVNKKCAPCEGGVDPIKGPQIQEYLKNLSNEWHCHDEIKIVRNYKFKDFKEAIKFINKVADIAESEGHHPDITIHYNKVKIKLWTHSINGLSENDFIIAAKIDNTHYICSGSCHGVSTVPGACQAEDCPKHGQALEKCGCSQPAH